MSDVFISYSRKDSRFAKRLTNALKRHDHDVWIDWKDIPRGADWLNAIYEGIEAADSFAFIVSQYSLTSEICNDEIAYARKHNKRIIPLIRQKIEGDVEKWVKGFWYDVKWEPLAKKNWDALSHLNWIFFDDDATFDSELGAFIDAISVDHDHVKWHTRLLVRARYWESRSKNPSLLLFGDEIEDAEKWLQKSEAEDKHPTPTQLHDQYIAISRERDLFEKRRLRNLRGASITAAIIGIIAIFSTVVALYSANEAQERLGLAHTSGTEVGQRATLNSLERTRDGILIRRFGIIPTNETVLEPLDIFETATAQANPTEIIHDAQLLGDTEMVRVPAGCFLMGSVIDGASPVHEVCLDTFWIDRYEVTIEQFEQCFDCVDKSPFKVSSRENQPVTQVNWDIALLYCQTRDPQNPARLPTEAEWEYAARGPDSLVYPWGDEFIEENVIFVRTSENQTASVGSRPDGQSWIGAMDMSGNVWEWVSTIFDDEKASNAFPYPYNEKDGRENLERSDVLRVIRGGGHLNSALGLRAAERSGREHIGTPEVGFRCASSVSK